MKMNDSLLAAAISGIVLGAGACANAPPAQTVSTSTTSAPVVDGTKHACKGQNNCKGQGGCKVEGKNACKGQNTCKAQGGCKMS